jgi:hypothetical protein
MDLDKNILILNKDTLQVLNTIKVDLSMNMEFHKIKVYYLSEYYRGGLMAYGCYYED